MRPPTLIASQQPQWAIADPGSRGGASLAACARAMALLVALAQAVVFAPPMADAAARTPSQTQRETHNLPAAVTFPADGQGTYDSCPPAASTCLAHLDMLAQAGFSLVINYGQITPTTTILDEAVYAIYAQQVGLRVIWPVTALLYDANRDHTLAAAYPAMNQSMIQAGVCPGYDGSNYWFAYCFARSRRGLDGSWGYYIGDELPASSEPGLRHLVDAIADADASHPRLYVAGGTDGATNRADLDAYSRTYCDGSACRSDATVIAQDFYPIGTPLQSDGVALTSRIAADVQAIAAQNGLAYGMVLQAHSLAEYPQLYNCPTPSSCPYPSEQQMLAMRDAVLAHPTPRLLLWYSSLDVFRSDNPPQHWADLVAAVNAGRPHPTPVPSSSTPVSSPPAPSSSGAPAGSAAAQRAESASEPGAWAALTRSTHPLVWEVLAQAGLLAVLLLTLWLRFRRRSRPAQRQRMLAGASGAK